MAVGDEGDGDDVLLHADLVDRRLDRNVGQVDEALAADRAVALRAAAMAAEPGSR